MCFGRHAFTLAGASALAALAGTACSESPSEETCEELLAHVVEIEVASAAGEPTGDTAVDELEQKQTDVEMYLGDDFVQTCVDTYSRERVTCALGAESYEALVECGES